MEDKKSGRLKKKFFSFPVHWKLIRNSLSGRVAVKKLFLKKENFEKM